MGLEAYQPPVPAPVVDVHRQPGLGQALGERVGPFDEGDGVVADARHDEAELLVVRRREPVGVDVGHRHRARIALGEREGGAGDGLGDAERAGDRAHQRGLAGAEVAAQQHEVARAQQVREPPPEGGGVLGAGARELRGVAQKRPSCSRAAAATGCGSGSGSGSGSAGDGGPMSPGMRAKSSSRVASMARV